MLFTIVITITHPLHRNKLFALILTLFSRHLYFHTIHLPLKHIIVNPTNRIPNRMHFHLFHS